MYAGLSAKVRQGESAVSLLGPKERGKPEELGLPDKSGRSAAVVDVLHRAADSLVEDNIVAIVVDHQDRIQCYLVWPGPP